MGCLLQETCRPAPTFPQCQHGEHSISCISTVLLLRIGPDGTRYLHCKVCSKQWEE
jgi:hypothetical protein